MSLFKAEKKKPSVILAVLVNLSIPYNFLDPKDNTLFSKRKLNHILPLHSLFPVPFALNPASQPWQKWLGGPQFMPWFPIVLM